MKLYDLVKDILEAREDCRNSDKVLLWAVWEKLGIVFAGYLSSDQFLKAPTPETITRCRRKIQAYYPHLASSKEVQAYKEEKQATGGNFVFQEKIV